MERKTLARRAPSPLNVRLTGWPLLAMLGLWEFGGEHIEDLGNSRRVRRAIGFAFWARKCRADTWL